MIRLNGAGLRALATLACVLAAGRAWSADCLAASTPVASIGMRVLLITADGSEAVLPAIRSTLQHVGIPYDEFVAKDGVLDAGMLCEGRDGSGSARYQGVLLATGNLGYDTGGGVYQSALSTDEWNLLWRYEAKYRVRQASFYTVPGAAPDGFGLNPPDTVLDTGPAPLPATLTSAGAAVFRDLNPASPVVVRNAYAYLARPASSSVTPLLVDAAGHAVASINAYPDGRRSLQLTVDGAPPLIHSLSLNYGIVNWVTKGLYIGKRRVALSPQPDDVGIASSIWDPLAGSDTSGRTYRITGNDLWRFSNWQSWRNLVGPGTVEAEMPFNAYGTTADFPTELLAPGAFDSLTPAIRALHPSFRWMSHTFTHLTLDAPVTYDETLQELRNNDSVATGSLWLTRYARDSLVTPNISGLNNPEAMQAMRDFGIRYIVSDSSKYCGNRHAGIAACPPPNHGVYHDLQPSILMVPRYPTNLFYNVCRPDDWTSEYNHLYRAYWGRDLGYAEILDKESEVLLRYLLAFDQRPLMFHQSNLCAYDGTRSLLGDLIDATVSKFKAISNLPPNSRGLRDIGAAMADRMRLDAALAAPVGARLEAHIIPGAYGSSIRIRNATASALKLPVTGLSNLLYPNRETYGGQTTTTLGIGAGRSVDVSGAPPW